MPDLTEQLQANPNLVDLDDPVTVVVPGPGAPRRLSSSLRTPFARVIAYLEALRRRADAVFVSGRTPGGALATGLVEPEASGNAGHVWHAVPVVVPPGRNLYLRRYGMVGTTAFRLGLVAPVVRADPTPPGEFTAVVPTAAGFAGLAQCPKAKASAGTADALVHANATNAPVTVYFGAYFFENAPATGTVNAGWASFWAELELR